MTRYAAKVDANQNAIVKALEQVGASVLHLHRVGQGCPDLLVGYRGENYLIEVKDGSLRPSARKLRKTQVDFHTTWRGKPVAVAGSKDEAMRAIGCSMKWAAE